MQRYMAVNARCKYIYSESNGIEEPYDLANDLHELRNPAAARGEKDVSRRLRREIVRWRAENGDLTALDGDNLRRTAFHVEAECHFRAGALGRPWY
jgi:hypothetical protein